MKFRYILSKGLLGLSCLTIAVSCKSKVSPEAESAAELFNQVSQAIDDGNGSLALSLLDSIDRNFSVSSDIKRKSIELRPRAIGLDAKAQLELVNDSIETMTAQLDSIAALMKHVDIAGTDGYYIEKKKSSENALSTTCVTPRVDDLGCFYLVSSVVGAGNLHHSSITFTVEDKTASTDTIPYDGEINYRIDGSEMINFMPKRVERVAQLLSDASPSTKVTIRFNGENGRSKSIVMNTNDFSVPLAYSTLINHLRRLTLEQERLNQKINLADSKARNSSKE